MGAVAYASGEAAENANRSARFGPSLANRRSLGGLVARTDVRRLRTALGSEGFEAEYRAGRALTPDDVLALALRLAV